jgi:hypothetical protein
MEIGLLLNSNNQLQIYSEKYKEILNKNSIPYRILDPNSNLLLRDLKGCSHLLFNHTQGDTDILIYETLFNIAQNIYKIQCFPNYETFWPYENKIKEYYLLKSHDFPMIDSRVFWNHENAYEFLRETNFPIVAKLPKGAGSSNVVIVNSISEGKKIIDQVFKKGVKLHGLKSKSNLASLSHLGILKYAKGMIRPHLVKIRLLEDKPGYEEWQIQKDSILFQKYLPDNDFDIRVTVIGNRAFAFRRFVRNNDFRASGSGKIDTNKEKIDLQCLKIAFRISKDLSFVTMTYDFIYDENHEPKISEISYCFVDLIVKSCPGFWDDSLQWHPGYFWPQHCQLEDFLGMELKI